MTTVLFWILLICPSRVELRGDSNLAGYAFTVEPAALGHQWIRTSVPLPRGFLRANHGVEVLVGGKPLREFGTKELSVYAPVVGAKHADPPTVRRLMITFHFKFKTFEPVTMEIKPARKRIAKFPLEPVKWTRESIERFELKLPNLGKVWFALESPARRVGSAPKLESVEENEVYRWERYFLEDPEWPRIIEIRQDALGGCIIIAHIKRSTNSGNFAPVLGWFGDLRLRNVKVVGTSSIYGLKSGEVFEFTNSIGIATEMDGGMEMYHPLASASGRGRTALGKTHKGRVMYKFDLDRENHTSPMQHESWHRVELVMQPKGRAPLGPTWSAGHKFVFPAQAWEDLYSVSSPIRCNSPEVEAILAYHRLAITRSAAIGDDFGNVTGYQSGQFHGGVMGMNRLNHGGSIFEEGWRWNDPLLVRTGILWCENFYDRSIWWGEHERGGTRYNNRIAMGKSVPDSRYMWRSDSAVHFCTKGYDCFWLAYEETGDPRMLEALRAQVKYAGTHIHATGECRNIGDVRDYVRLYEWTGEPSYLAEALRLFSELRTKLSPHHLFDQGGKPLSEVVPYIDDDEGGYRVGYAKPYILGYALAGLPGLYRHAPDEPRLKETIRSVADYLSKTVDPAGGWRYPHPNSSTVIISQGMEHAWQLVQAGKSLGPEARWLDAIEVVLRARFHGWRKTGTILSGLGGWEAAQSPSDGGKVLRSRYKQPSDRDASRDYDEGQVSVGNSSPEGLVYFSEVLDYYLQHRSLASLIREPQSTEPLGRVLSRVPKKIEPR